MSRSFVLPEASLPPCRSSSRSCPAPSATTTTALPRSATRCRTCSSSPCGPSSAKGTSGISTTSASLRASAA